MQMKIRESTGLGACCRLPTCSMALFRAVTKCRSLHFSKVQGCLLPSPHLLHGPFHSFQKALLGLLRVQGAQESARLEGIAHTRQHLRQGVSHGPTSSPVLSCSTPYCIVLYCTLQ